MDNYLLALKAYQKALKAYQKYVDECMEYLNVVNNTGVTMSDADGPGTLPPGPPPTPKPPGS